MTEQVDSEQKTTDLLSSVTKGAGLFVGGRVFERAVGFVTQVVLTNSLGPQLYGIYSYVMVLLPLFRIFTILGGDRSLLRYLPEYEGDTRKRRVVVTIAYGSALLGSLSVSAIVYVSAPLISSWTLSDPLFTEVLQIVSILIPFNTTANLTLQLFRSIDRMDYNVGIASVVRPFVRLSFVGGAVLLGYSLTGAVAGLIVSGLVLFVVSTLILLRRTEFNTVAQPSRSDVFEYYDFSVPLTFSQLGSFLYSRVDILMVGFLLTGSAVGIYNVAVMISGFLALPLSAFNQLFPPVASSLYHDGDHSKLASIYSTVTRWILSGSLVPSLAIVLYANEVLAVFGDGFVQASNVLIIFTIAQLANAAVGPSGYLLMMTDRQYLTLANQTGSAILNVVLNYLFILEFGIIGAALATAGVVALINVVRLLEVWYIHGMTPYTRQYYKPLAAGAIAGGVMYCLKYVLGQYQLLVIGGCLGVLSFAVTLYVLGIEDDEMELFRRLVS